MRAQTKWNSPCNKPELRHKHEVVFNPRFHSSGDATPLSEDYIRLPLSMNTLQTTNTYWQDAFCCSLSSRIHFSHNYSEPNVGYSSLLWGGWRHSTALGPVLPTNPSGARHLPVLSSTIVFTFMVWDLKNTSADLVLFAGKLQNLPDVLPVELIAVIHCGYLPCSCCPSPRRLLAKADTRAVLVNKTRNFTTYSKSPDEKLAHSYLQHQSCLTPH